MNSLSSFSSTCQLFQLSFSKKHTDMNSFFQKTVALADTWLFLKLSAPLFYSLSQFWLCPAVQAPKTPPHH